MDSMISENFSNLNDSGILFQCSVLLVSGCCPHSFPPVWSFWILSSQQLLNPIKPQTNIPQLGRAKGDQDHVWDQQTAWRPCRSQEGLPAPPHILQGHEECFNPWFPAPSTPCPCRGKGSVMDPLFPCRTTAVLPPDPHPSWCSSSAVCSPWNKDPPTAANPQGVAGGLPVPCRDAGGPGSPREAAHPWLRSFTPAHPGAVLRMKGRHSAGIPVTLPQGTKAPQENKHERLAGKI